MLQCTIALVETRPTPPAGGGRANFIEANSPAQLKSTTGHVRGSHHPGAIPSSTPLGDMIGSIISPSPFPALPSPNP